MNVVWRDLGLVDYRRVWQAMQGFTRLREPASVDELWAVEHPPVFTQGRAGKSEHLLAPGSIPVVNSDRGGQVTYHGPGQLVVYALLDVKRLGIGPRELVRRLERGVITYLAGYGIAGERVQGAPGVYVGGAKIAALGLRIRNGCSYHGLALNVAMDLEPFTRINPCGYAGLAVTQLSEHGGAADCADVLLDLLPIVANSLYDGAPIVLRQDRNVYAEALVADGA
jgi:lipoyl(octanoyl) transferase